MLRRLFGGGDPGQVPPNEQASRQNSSPAQPGSPDLTVDRTLQDLETGPDTFAIFVADGARNEYVQVSISDDGRLFGEAVGDEYLKRGATLSEGSLQALRDLGWTVVGRGKGNHTRTWSEWKGESRAHVVADILWTLRLAYGMAPDGSPAVETGH